MEEWESRAWREHKPRAHGLPSLFAAALFSIDLFQCRGPCFASLTVFRTFTPTAKQAQARVTRPLLTFAASSGDVAFRLECVCRLCVTGSAHTNMARTRPACEHSSNRSPTYTPQTPIQLDQAHTSHRCLGAVERGSIARGTAQQGQAGPDALWRSDRGPNPCVGE